MTVTSWKTRLKAALHRNRSDRSCRYLQLATVDVDNRPHNRTVVYRGFIPDTDIIQIASDRRSEKVAHLQHTPGAAICWYFSKTREQFRISGTMEIIASLDGPTISSDESCRSWQKARHLLWQQLSDPARLQWYWPHPRSDRDPAQPFVESLPDGSGTPPSDFILLLFHPTEIDHLELRGDPQNRHIFQLQSSQWQMRAVNP